MKKLFALLVASAILFSLCACGSASNEGNAGNEGNEESVPNEESILLDSEETAILDEDLTIDAVDDAPIEDDTLMEDVPIIVDFDVWEQPNVDEFLQSTSAKMTEISVILTTISQNTNDWIALDSSDEVLSTESYQAVVYSINEWGYGANHFDFSLYTEQYPNAEELQTLFIDIASEMEVIAEMYPTWIMENNTAAFNSSVTSMIENASVVGNMVADWSMPIIIAEEPITVDDFATLTYHNASYQSEVHSDAAKAGNRYYAVQNTENLYLVLEFSIENLSSDMFINSVDNVIDVTATYKEQYNYTSLMLAEAGNNTGLGSTFYLNPLNTTRLIAMIEVPKLLEGETVEAKVTFCGNQYKLVIN